VDQHALARRTGGYGRAGISLEQLQQMQRFPAGLTFGVELELVFPAQVTKEQLGERLEGTGWQWVSWPQSHSGGLGVLATVCCAALSFKHARTDSTPSASCRARLPLTAHSWPERAHYWHVLPSRPHTG
jgi:hypothetical protein